MTNHDRFAEAFKDLSGQEFSTQEIMGRLHKMFPEMKKGSMLPNDHGEGNASPCWCSKKCNEQYRIFDRVKPKTYRVRRFIIKSK